MLHTHPHVESCPCCSCRYQSRKLILKCNKNYLKFCLFDKYMCVNVFHPTFLCFFLYPIVQQWILQEKQRLTAFTQRVTQESGVQTDVIPESLLGRLTSHAPEDQEEPTLNRPCQVVKARKKAVQEELIKHHALCRAESRIRRKRLQYQLERIARKQHLLEAKRELQQLEKALPPGPDSPESLEQVSPSNLRGRHFVSRRHSCSADLLSRLYPQHTPIFR